MGGCREEEWRGESVRRGVKAGGGGGVDAGELAYQRGVERVEGRYRPLIWGVCGDRARGADR